MEKKPRKKRKLDLNIDTPKVDINVIRDEDNIKIDIRQEENSHGIIQRIGEIARVILKKRG